jgi:hypothetical protein
MLIAEVTRNQHSTTDQFWLVPTGLEKPIHGPDTSSSEKNPTGIAHHAHTLTEELETKLSSTIH